MSATSAPSLARYRPAVFTVTAIAAAVTVYYVHRSFWSQPRGLHRRNAVHRRHRGRQSVDGSGDQRSSDVSLEIGHLDADGLRALLDQQFASEQSISIDQAPSIEINDGSSGPPQIRFRYEDAPLRQYLRNVQQFELGSTERTDYEHAFLTSFLEARVPPRTRLVTSGGNQGFLERLTASTSTNNVYFSSFDAVASAVLLFNMRAVDANMPNRESVSSGIEGARHLISSFDPQEHELRQAGNYDSIVHEPNTIDPSMGLVGLTTDDESEHSWREENDNEESKRDGQSLLTMLYHIAEDQSRRDGYIHRGIGCNSCNTTPIRGIRYRCSNCYDYDLCEQCESLQIHPKTHLFYKIRIPAPFFDAPRYPQTPRYPGKPAQLPNHLPRETVKYFGKESGSEAAEIEALWDQFKCLAATEWPADPHGFRMAINKNVFDHFFLPGPLKRRKPPNMPIHDRIFAFFDTNRDGLIGFNEFLLGIASIRTNDKNLKSQRIFNCYDMDSDGLVRRKDFLRLFWSYYTLTKDFTEDVFMTADEDVMEGDTLRETLQGSQPISATFTGSVNPQEHISSRESKRIGGGGEPFISDEGSVFIEDDANLGGQDEVIADMVEFAEFGGVLNLDGLPQIVKGKEHEHPLYHTDWPPPFIQKSDVEDAIGPGISASSVTNLYDRLKILQQVLRRRESVRKEALRKREKRRQFYNHEHKSNSKSEVREEFRPSNPLSDISENEVDEERLAPPLEADAGQEYLYQILEESMNELLDPLFRAKEDLHVEAILCKRDLEELSASEFSYFNCKDFRDLCTIDLELFLQDLYDRSSTEYDIPEALWSWIVRLHDPCDKSYIPYMGRLFQHRLITEEEHNEKILLAREQLQTCNESESDQSSSSIAEKYEQRIAHRNTPESSLEIGDAHQHIIEEIDGRVVIRTESTNGLDGELSQAAERWTDDAVQLEQAIAETPLDELLEGSGYSMIDLGGNGRPFPCNDHGSGKTDLSTSSEAQQTTPNETLIPGPSEEIEEDVPDPTLPHRRPNSPSKKSRISHAPPVRDVEQSSVERMRLRWKYIIMLGCLRRQDEERGGPGSLSYPEFQSIMQGPIGGDLDFLAFKA